MKQTLNLTTLIIYFCFLQLNLWGQTIVYPGDINNNGVVSGVDLLYFGTAFEATGQQRPSASLQWLGQEVDQLWSEEFPEGINLSYADADGNGIVDEMDLLGGIVGNFEKLHGTVGSEGYMNGVEGVDPMIALLPHSPTAFPNSELGFDVILGSSDFPINEFYGISFIVSFDFDVIDPMEGVNFQVANNAWIDETGNNHRKIATLRNDGSIEFAITRLNKIPVSGSGNVASFFIIIEDFVSGFAVPDTVKVSIDHVRLTNQNLETFPVAVSEAEFALVESASFSPPSANCPNIVAPVCGSNGFTYLNSCYALEAGVTNFTSGVCYSSCIEPSLITPDAVCPTVNEPVCGCNNVTYANACTAEKSGVTTYISGACDGSICYNPQQVTASGNTSVNPDNGVITTNCPGGNDPVCGCDGITYPNACMAEASGITFYTSGSCGTCVDPWTMNPDALCTFEYDPVCGCNGETYLNACQATAAGITDFTNGSCGSTSTWCNEAIPIQCGDFLPNETTIGAGNDISIYQNCINTTLVGPDKVYVINKNTPGDLQIGLEITTPNLDLDLILLDANCSVVTCLAASHTNNSVTNNEGILYADAPIGTYYIVVDGQYATSEGNYRLEVSCAYLDCTDSQPLVCGVPFNGNNIDGNDNVSLYYCGNVLNVENNGPEMVHTFTITEPGQVDISLTGLSANLELFLLDACDNSECLEFSQNGGSGSEFITTFLAPGTYYIVVDGYNGATSDYSLQVNCEGSCELDFSITANNADCINNDGSITILTENGVAPYIISWVSSSGVSGTIATYQPTYIINNLPTGAYSVTVTDAFGCEVTKIGNVLSQGGLDFSATPNAATNCTDEGSIFINIFNVAPNPTYQIKLDGPVAQLVTINTSSYNFEDLPAGDYIITVADNNGCVLTQTITLNPGGGLNYQATPNAAECGELGSIDVEVFGGTPPFSVQVTGTVNGSGSAQTNNFSIQNLPGGNYLLTIRDNTGCQSTQQVNVPNLQLDISATAFDGACGANGSISVSVNSGTLPFTLVWSGAANGTATNNSGSFIIPNLPTGSYSIQVTDGDGCTDFQTISLDNSAPALDVDVTTYDASCDEPGYIWVSMNDGTAPFTISYSGPISGSNTTNNSFYQITNAVSGSYNVVVSDANGCTYSESVTVEGGSDLSFQASAGSNNCGQNGSVNVNIFNGDAPFTIVWNGPNQGSLVTNNINSIIENLASGTYSIQVTDANECTDETTVVINSTNSLTFTAIPNDGDCEENGTISINISGGNGNYNVSWNGPTFGSFNTTGNSFVIPNLPSGTYSIVINDSDGCNAMQSVTLINGGSSNVAATLTPNLGSCGQNGSISVTITSGTGPYLVEYTGPASGFQSSVSGTNFIFPNLPPGNYIFTITAGNDCSIMESVFLSASNAMTFVANTDEGTCGQFGDINLNISGGTAPYNVSWTGPTSSSVNVSGNNYSIINLIGGIYTIIINDNNGCSVQQEIELDNGENVQYWATPTSGGCGELGSILIDVSTGVAPFTISWSGLSTGTTTTFNSNFTISNLPSDSYNITVFDADGCGDNETVLLNNANDLILTVSENHGFCGELGSLSLNMSGGNAPYLINMTGAAGSNFTANGNAAFIPNLPSGNYNITVTSADGCVVSQAATLNEEDGINIWATPNHGTCTQSGSILVDVTGGTAPFNIQWSGAATGNMTSNSSVFTIPNLNSGTYTVTVFDANGCADSKTTTLNSVDGVTLSASANNGFCGQSGSISLNFSGGDAPYAINYNGPTSGNLTANGNSSIIPNLPTGTYNITVTNADGCTATQNATILNGGNIVISATANNGNCGQQGNILVNITDGTAPFTITWTGQANGSNTTSQSNFTIPNLFGGNYTINVTDANGCVASQNATLTSSNPVTLFAAANNGDCGQLGNIDLSFSGGNAPFTINWNGTSAGTNTVTGNAFNISNLQSGNYNITVTNAAGCAATQSATISNSGSISFTASPSNATCGQAGEITVTVANGTAPYTLNWTGAQSGNFTITNTNTYTISALPSGSYNLMLTDANGCSSNQSVTLNNGSAINFTATVSNGSCGQLGSVALNVSGGNGDYLALLASSNGNSSAPFTGNFYTVQNLVSGSYTVVVSDSNGCSSTQSLNINNGTTLNLMATGINGACGQNGQINLIFSNGNPPFNLNWTGQTTGNVTVNGMSHIIPNLPTGNYNLNVTDNNNCSGSTSVAINNGTSFTATAVGTNVTCNGANNGSATVNTSGSIGTLTYAWSNGGNTQTINSLLGGTYSVTVTDQNNCQKTASVVVSEPSAISLVTTSTNATCGGSNGSATVNPSGGNAPYSFLWSNTGMGQTIFGITTGTYTVTVTDANSCTQTASVLVGNDSQNTISNFNTNVNGLNISFINSATAATTYAWDFGDGNTSILPNATNVYDTEGTYNVCLTTTNACNSDTYCENITVTIPANYAILEIGEVVGNSGDILSVPVMIQNVATLASVAGSIQIENLTVGTIIGLTDGLITPSFNPALNTFSFFSGSGFGLDVDNGDILFYIDVEVNGNAGDETQVKITNNPLPIEVGIMQGGAPMLAPHAVLQGSASISNTTIATINGNIQTWWGEGINNVTVDVWNDNFDETYYTDIDGNYVTNPMTAGQNFIFEPTKDTLDSNGISTFGLFVGQQYILGNQPPQIISPYQIIAGDANCNGVFSTLDLFAIQQQLIGGTQTFANCPSWVFIPEGFQMAGLDNPQSIFPYPSIDTMLVTVDAESNFVGVKIGDLLGDANPELLLAADDRSGDFVLTTKNQSAQAGDIIEISLSTKELKHLATMQFALNFNENQIQFLAIENGKIENPLTALSTNELRFSWFDLSGNGLLLNEKENLFTLRFQALQNVNDLAESLYFKNDHYKSIVYEPAGISYNLQLQFENEQPTFNKFNLYQNVPNPFGEVTSIPFELPAAAFVKLTMQNSRGEIIKVIENDFAKGRNEILLEKEGLSGGVYYYTLETEGFVETRRMVVL